jgi:DNA-binding CsgD family transcriptional regulator
VSAELDAFCGRVLGESPEAAEVALAARRAGGDRIDGLAMAARMCRDRPDHPSLAPPTGEASGDLAGNVAAEMAHANAQLPERQREALALRELLRLSYADIAIVMGIEPAAVAALLARARLRLRAERRQVDAVLTDACPDADRALRILARRHDSESLPAEDEDWIYMHLAECGTCEMAHGAMLEASSCYRAWPRPAPIAAG